MVFGNIIYLIIGMSAFFQELFKQKKGFLILSCFVFLFVAAFRDVTVGSDTPNYYSNYQIISTLNPSQIFLHRWEQGYVLYNWLISHISLDFCFFSIMTSAGIVLVQLLTIRQYSISPCLSIVIMMAMGYFAQSLSALRHMMAFSILLCSIKYIQTRELVKFTALIVLAGLFHRTSVVFFLLYFTYRYRFKAQHIIGYGIVMLSMGLMGDLIRTFLNLFARIPEKGNYNGGITILIVFIICIVSVLMFAKEELKNEQTNMFFNSLLIAAAIQPITLSFSNWSRVVTFFSFSLWFIIPFIIKGIMKFFREKVIAKMIIVLIMISAMSVWYNISSYRHLVDYSFVFGNLF